MARLNLARGIGLPLIIITVLALGSLSACRVDDLPSDDSINIALVGPVFPPPSGDGRVIVRVSDENDQPVDAATLKIRGDMANPGMVPIEASLTGGENGVFRIPVYWTMAGDWIVTVEATLDDGRRTSRVFDLTVTGEEKLCIEVQ